MINIIFLAAAAFLALIGVFLYYQNNKIDITDYDINADSIKDEIKIIHLSDLHSKPFHKVMDIVQAKKPDLILITGDYINDRCKNKEKMIAFGKALVNIAPVYYITGNHERRLEQFEGLMEELKSIGFHVLLNELACTTVKNSTINILGLDENQADFDDYKARKMRTDLRLFCHIFPKILKWSRKIIMRSMILICNFQDMRTADSLFFRS